MPLILVVDDNISVLQSLEIYLQSEGHAVLLAADGPTALRLAAENPVDAVMLDIEMPQMSGLAVCQALRKDPALRHLPVLMMTGRPTREIMARAREAGASVVMGKPFDLENLKATLAGLLAPVASVLVAEVQDDRPDKEEFQRNDDDP